MEDESKFGENVLLQTDLIVHRINDVAPLQRSTSTTFCLTPVRSRHFNIIPDHSDNMF